mmetsp:Transcript_24166/g.42679  ORF Transcript_24166/g.42679 Transcript_24166/m.42679 type:complete len:484 (-) Transcript_24166:195-1646(-)
MIAYDNSRQFGIILQYTGSVIPSALPIGIFTSLLGLALAVCREFAEEWGLQSLYEQKLLVKPVAIQILALVIGYLLVVRTNMALARWMEGISDVQIMLSKWTDAYTQLNGFFSGRQDTEDKRILFFRVRIAHWFSLMSCLAFSTLRGGELTSLEDTHIKEMFPAQVDVPRKSKSFAACGSLRLRSQIEQRSSAAPEEMDDMPFIQEKRAEENRKQEQQRALDLYVLANPTSYEVELLESVTDKVNLIMLWIIQGICLEVRAKTLDAPPPIVTRVLQELSNGMLGFNQAHKVAMVPFPFPFAQMVSILLCFLYIVVPFYVDAFTQNIVVTPLISFVIPVAYHGLNHIAIELEEPFGLDYNDIDIEGRHTEFLQMLVDTIRQPIIPPVSKENSLEGRIRKGCTKRHQRILKEIGSPMVLPKDLDQEGGGADVMSRDLADLVNGSMAAYNYDKDPAVEVEETWLDESHREESFGSLLYSQGLSWSR